MQTYLNHVDQTHEVVKRLTVCLEAGSVEIIELDMSQMDRMTSETLNELISLNTRAKSRGVRLVLVNLADNLREVFTITRLERMFELA